jgi:hypothetical protein
MNEVCNKVTEKVKETVYGKVRIDVGHVQPTPVSIQTFPHMAYLSPL